MPHKKAKKIKQPKRKYLKVNSKNRLVAIGFAVVIIVLIISIIATFPKTQLTAENPQTLFDKIGEISPATTKKASSYIVSPTSVDQSKTNSSTSTPTPTQSSTQANPTATPTPAPANGSILVNYVASNGDPFTFDGAKVTLVNKNSGQTYAITDKPSFSITDVPGGSYSIKIETYSDFSNSIVYCYEGETCYADEKISGNSGSVFVKGGKTLKLNLVYYHPYTYTPAPSAPPTP